jgi:MFS family permease
MLTPPWENNSTKPFYGWIIVGVIFLIGVTESGAFQNILSIFLKPMVREFGWSRAAVAAAMVFGSIGAGVLAPFVGAVLDRHGPKMVAFGGTLILSAGIFGMGFINHLWQLYLFFGIGRMVAMGALALVVPVTVSNWFVRKRGRAMGIVWLGPRMGAAILPALTQYFIVTQGWRMAWMALGVVVFLLSGVPSLLFLRRRPEDLDLLPDGDFPQSDGSRETAPVAKNLSAFDLEPSWSLAQAIRMPSFWGLTVMESLFLFVQAGTNFHIFPYLTDQGMSAPLAVLTLSIIAVSGSIGSIVWGTFSEKITTRILLSLNGFGSGFIFLLLYWVVEIEIEGGIGMGLVLLLAAVHGQFHGGRFPILSVAWAEFFGRKSLGSIYGATSPLRYTANAIGPIFGAVCFDLFGSYMVPFYIFTCLFLVNGVIAIYLKPPSSKDKKLISAC